MPVVTHLISYKEMIPSYVNTLMVGLFSLTINTFVIATTFDTYLKHNYEILDSFSFFLW